MSKDFIGVTMEGDIELSRKLRGIVSESVKRRANKMIAAYVKLQAQKYPPKRKVTREQAFGQTFESDKQRKWFFSAIHSGAIKVPYRRTGALRRGWNIMAFGSSDFLVYNESDHAAFVMGSGTQSRMMIIIGWKTIEMIAKDAQDEARRIMSDELQKETGRIVYV